MDSKKRPSWDEYFMDLADTVSKRATCDRGASGCVITKDKRILTTGYVGAPVGLPHCDEVGHIIKEVKHEDGEISKHCLRTSHAEMNAIVQAARNGIPIEGSTIYCNMIPCKTCGMAMANAGVKRVVAKKFYHRGKEAIQIFKEANIDFQVLSSDMETYKDM